MIYYANYYCLMFIIKIILVNEQMHSRCVNNFPI